MKQIQFGNTGEQKPAIIIGGMRLNGMTPEEMNSYIHTAMDCGANFFDYADIYGGGSCEELFGKAWKKDASIHREDLFLQSKCGICSGYYDMSKEHILEAVDGILKRMDIEYLDALLLHRPDALMEPEEVAAAFDQLQIAGKVRHFGVSNFNPAQIELLKKYVKQPLEANQLQFSIPVSNMVAAGLEVNMETPGSVAHDGYVLDYSRLNNMTIQAWSPFQMPAWRGVFIGSEEYKPLNDKMTELSEKYGVSATTIATAWILRHPANMQVIAGTTSKNRLAEIVAACDVELTRKEWYELYLAAGHPLP